MTILNSATITYFKSHSKISTDKRASRKLIVRNASNGKASDEVLYAYQGTYTSDDLYLNSGLKPSTIPTPDLKWEGNRQWNIGLDFSVLNRISSTLEYYSRTSRDLLYYNRLYL